MDTTRKAIGVKNINQPSIVKTVQEGSAIAVPSLLAFYSYPPLYLPMPISLVKGVRVANGDTIQLCVGPKGYARLCRGRVHYQVQEAG